MGELDIRRIIQEAGHRSSLEPKDRYVEDLDTLVAVVAKLRAVENVIVLTSGTFDILHIGQSRYIRKAKEHGDILIVAVDDDEKARARKGENRPIIPFEERIEMLAHTRYADIVTKKRHDDPKWQVLKRIHPDVFVAVEGTYTPQEVHDLGEYCGKVVVLPRQAETSTSAKVRKLVLDGAENITAVLMEELPKLVRDVYQRVKEGKV